MSNPQIANSSKTYYISTFECCKSVGLFALYMHVFQQVAYAFANGYIPVVDLKNCDSMYFKDGREGIDNVWEYFFEQPCGISLEQIPPDAKIVKSKKEDKESFLFNQDLCNIENSIKTCKKEYPFADKMRFNKETASFLEQKYKEIIGDETEVLAVLCRGTDYVALRPAYNCVQPEVHEVIEKAKELAKRVNYKKIYLATEDIEIYNTFQKEFGDMLIENPQFKLQKISDKFIYEYPVERKDHFYNLAKEYLASIYILSKCKYFIGGLTSGTIGVFHLSKWFENQKYVYIFNRGVYKVKVTFPVKWYEHIFSITNEYYEDNKHKVLRILGLKLKFNQGRTSNFTKEYCKL